MEEKVTLDKILEIETEKKTDLDLIRRICELSLELKNTSPFGTMFVLEYEDEDIEDMLDPIYNGQELLKNQYNPLNLYDDILDQMKYILSEQDDGAFLIKNNHLINNGYNILVNNREYLKKEKARYNQEGKIPPPRHEMLGFDEPGAGTRRLAALAAARDLGYIIVTVSEKTHKEDDDELTDEEKEEKELKELEERKVRVYIGNKIYQLKEPKYVQTNYLPDDIPVVPIRHLAPAI